MSDTIAYRIGDLKVVVRDDPDFIDCMEENLHLMQCPFVTGDSSEIDNLNDLFVGLV